jgi:hypothetical protein
MKARTCDEEATMTISNWQSGVLTRLIPSIRKRYAAHVQSIQFEPGKLECRIRISAPASDGIVSVRERKAVLTWLQ